ncbi:MAG: lytic transglycosylase domain-containing protein, partial [Ottowia sp.]|nr:lytic transglycosylase domain-containing protein [Ottowia sp.]
WRAPGGSGPRLDGAIWVENIPFMETRHYVKNVLANTVNYAAMLTGQPQSLRQRLGTIGPAAPDEVARTKDLP